MVRIVIKAGKITNIGMNAVLSLHVPESNVLTCHSPAFRKLFPEYVEKYNQQQLAEQAATQVTTLESPQKSDTKVESEKTIDPTKEDSEGGLKERKKNKKQGLPAWIILLLVSVFGVVMALPLLQL